MFEVDWKGLILPLAYVLVLGGTFVTFSTVYRQRKAAQSANLAPWFPPHLQRNVYLSLLHLEPEEGSSEKTPKVPDSVLRAALLRRAVEDIHRLVQIRTGKQACASLLQRGSVGDDLFQRFTRAEQEMEAELRDVVMEANALAPNWGQTIFQSANEIAANAMLRTRLDEIQAQADAEKEWWEKRRASISQDFMKELDEDESAKNTASSGKAATVGSDDEAVLVESSTPATTPSSASKKKKGKK
ncbi:uncharacterized protein E0L32_000631 [Thyridium curvatum]|uniref:Translocation protein n=1 Tax=Thyridium curvatum TaxID=1093900 RepID=A0A507B3A8_9PEZI|nr:uncharacterized protein E0L32_000631 [Thyridium curvatum]TPX14237.1 hypothetical protein E0L32_000631 [Thyridium curvatum]